MTLKFLLISIFIVSGLTLGACAPKNTNIEIQVIEFKNEKYHPNQITIKKDQKVRFLNQSHTDIWPASNIHPTHGIYPQFDPQKAIKPGGSWSFTFTKAGTWRFHDHLTPTITGTIEVN